jgi:hypothetical protein
MNEEYSVSENDQLTLEYYRYSEFNDESRIQEHEQYAVEDSYVPKEHDDYSSDGSAARLSRHSSVLRKNRNRLGRLLGLLASIAGPAIVVILILTTSVFVDVRGYRSEPESLEIELSLYSSSESTEFNAVLSDRDGNTVGSAKIDRADPTLHFTGLTPGELYYFEVFADGESQLKLNYLLPEAEKEEPDVPVPVITVAGEENSFDAVRIKLSAENIDPSDLRAEVNGQPARITVLPDDGTPVIIAEGLEPETEYTYKVTDAEGNELYSGTVTTEPRTPAEVTPQNYSCTMTEANAEFTVVNPDGNPITAKLDGVEQEFETEGDTVRFALSGLEINSSHTIEFYDWDGSVILSYPFETAARKGATVKLVEETVTLDSVSLDFSITNPDKNPLKILIDGETAEEAFTGTVYSTDLTGLSPEETHQIEFRDWDDSVIMSHSFSSRARARASVELTEETVDIESVYLAFSIVNPDRNPITVKYDGVTLDESVTTATYSRLFTDLTAGQIHTIEFTDWDGTVLLSRPFSPRLRTAATVSFTEVQAGYNSISLKLSVENPDNNELELQVNGSRVSADLSSASPSTVLTGLSPRTTYNISVVDVSRNTIAATRSATTATSVNWSQDGSGNATFVLTDEFVSAYPRATLTVTDSLGQRIPLTASSSANTYGASANDLVYRDSYTVKLTSGGNTIETLTADLTGKARPVFSLVHNTYGPATLSAAKSNEDHYSYIVYPGFTYDFKSGYIDTVKESQYEHLPGKLRWTALVMKDSSGNVVSINVSGVEVEGEDELNVKQNLEIRRLNGFDDDWEIKAGRYTAALYIADGYTASEMQDLVWDEESAQQLVNIFTVSGRQVSSSVNVTVRDSSPIGDGFFYDRSDPQIIRGELVLSLSCYYYPENNKEGFLTVVSAADPTTQLIDPISLGTTDNYGYDTGQLFCHTEGPVYVIMYTGSFSPENYLVVQYVTAP